MPFLSAILGHIEEVFDHPLLTLLQQVNPIHNQFDLWELTTLYQEVHGSAYWYLHFGPLGVPDEIWILPSQHVTPRRQPGSGRIVDAYEYRTGTQIQEIYGRAYSWPPPGPAPVERLGATPMRQYVRRWINEWDLKRLYPGDPVNIVFEKIETPYSEDPELEVPAEDDSGELAID